MTTKSTDDNRENDDDFPDALDLAHAKRNEAFQLRENANDDLTIVSQALCSFREAAHYFQLGGDFHSATEMLDNAAHLANGDGQVLEIRYDQVANLVRIIQITGCNESLRQLIQYYETHVCRICFGWLDTMEDVEEAMSEIFFKVFSEIRAGKCHNPPL